MFRLIFIISLCMFIATIELYSQTAVWGDKFSGSNSDVSTSVISDKDGNIYLVGNFWSSTLSFNNGKFVTNSGLVNGFIAKFNKDSICQWASAINSTSQATTSKIVVDGNKNIFIAGTFRNVNVTFNNGKFLPITQNSDSYLARYDSNGVCQWAESISGDFNDYANNLALDNYDNIYVGGNFNSITLTFNNGISVSNGSQFECFLAKYTSNGLCDWALTFDGDIDDFLTGMVADSIGNLYLIGYFRSEELVFNNGISLENTTMDYEDIFVTKYNSSGVCQWATRLSGTGTDFSGGIDVDSFGNIYLSGYFNSDTLKFNNNKELTGYSGNNNIYLAKFNNSGACQWAEKIIGASISNQASLVSVDNYGSPIIGGYFDSPNLDFNNGISLSEVGNQDAFFAKYDINGLCEWAEFVGSSEYDELAAITIDNSNNIIIAGHSEGDSLTLNNNITIQGGQSIWGFFAKYQNTQGTPPPTLQPPDLIYPQNEADNENFIINFTWKIVQNADEYEIQISTKNDFSDINSNLPIPFRLTATITDTMIRVPGFSPLSHYFWRVKSKNSQIQSSWSEIREFETRNQKISASLWAWGNNFWGQCGDGNSSGDPISEPKLIETDKEWIDVFAGNNISHAIKNDNTRWAWGFNGRAAYGNDSVGVATNVYVPTLIEDGGNWEQIESDEYATNGIRINGDIWGWGINNYGSIGDGTFIQRLNPKIVSNTNNWKKVSNDYDWALGIKENGTLWAWGWNRGRFGNGLVDDSPSPIKIGTDSNWVNIDAGRTHALAIKSDGTLWAWGNNSYGQLGIGNDTESFIPKQIGSSDEWIDIKAGYEHSLALKNDGTLWAWGNNSSGQLGIGNYNNQFTPQKVESNMKWVKIDAGHFFSLGQKVDGSLWSWGLNDNNRLGVSNVLTRNTPDTVSGNRKDFIRFSTKTNHVLALSNSAIFAPTLEIPIHNQYFINPPKLFRWKVNPNTSYYKFQISKDYHFNNIIFNRITDSSQTSLLNEFFINFTGFEKDKKYYWRVQAFHDSVYSEFSEVRIFTITDPLLLYAWGNNSNGQLGIGSNVSTNIPYLNKFSYIWTSIHTFDKTTLGIMKDGSLWAWGNNEFELYQNNGDSNIPQPIINDNIWTAASIGSNFVVSKTKNAGLYSWGINESGQLAQGNNDNVDRPLMISEDKWKHFSTGDKHLVAIKNDNTIWACGINSSGQLGLGNFLNQNSLQQISTDANWKSVSSNSNFNAGIRTDGTLWTWGNNDYGQLGDNTKETKSQPIKIGNDNDWAKVSLGSFHAIALKTDGTLWAWGRNTEAQLGLGNYDEYIVPTKIGSDSDWYDLAVGGNHNLAVKQDSSLWVWGFNDFGQLGDSNYIDVIRPKKLSILNKVVSIATGGSQSFVIVLSEGLPEKPKLISPKDSSIRVNLDVRLIWKNTFGANQYQVQVSEYEDFQDIIVNTSSIFDTTLKISNLEYETNYFWRVRLIDDTYQSDWSDVWKFTTRDQNITQNIPLESGWNLISSFIIPEEARMDSVFQDIVGNVLIAKNGAGKLFVPSYNINTIGDWNIHDGYQIYSTTPDTLKVTGLAAVPETDSIFTNTGWNMLGYLRNAPMSSPTALASLIEFNKLLIAKNGKGKLFVPAYNINTIINLVPGDGYQMYITGIDTLVYPANGASKVIINDKPLENITLKPEYESTGSDMTLIIEANYEDATEIGVYNTQGMLIGSGVFQNGKVGITIWGDDEYTETKDGASIGELLNIKVLENGNLIEKEVKYSNGTDLIYERGSFVVGKINVATVENTLKLTPNPATDKLTIELPNAEIQSIEIRDMKGKLIMNEEIHLMTSSHQMNIDSLTNGTYFITVTTERGTITDKFVKIK